MAGFSNSCNNEVPTSRCLAFDLTGIKKDRVPLAIEEKEQNQPGVAIVHVALRLRHVWLLVALVALFLVSPLVAETGASRLTVGTLFTLVVVAAAVSSGESRWRRLVAIWLAGPRLSSAGASISRIRPGFA